MRVQKVLARVTGQGPFPIDMLRYDACWPLTEQDSTRVAEDDGAGPRGVIVARNVYGAEGEVPAGAVGNSVFAKDRNWTPERWRSFGWVLTEVQS